ncbi:hypothetical protein [Streptomyces sp. Tue6028]|uniref:hypothetical protein n=1 Tax=Streptomyces sp. Tue6028 TaxID=2036037 RepID=UPI003EBDA813
MSFAAFLAFFKAIGEVLGTVNTIYQFVKNIEELSQDPSDPARSRFLSTYAQLMESRRATLAASANVVKEVRTLDERIFRSTLADKLGDADQAVQDLENWRRSDSAVSRDLALDSSAGALSDMLQLESSGAYPPLALVLGHIQILGARLAVLSEADPGFGKSSVARRPIQAGIDFIRACVTEIEQEILAANEIEVIERVTQGPRPSRQGPRPQFHWVRISYANISGTSSFDTEVGPQEETSPDISTALQRAESARVKGMADDRTGSRIKDFNETADRFERMLHAAELRIVEDVVGLPVSRIERARYTALRSNHDVVDSLDSLLQNSGQADTISFKTAAQALGRTESIDEDERLLRDVMQRFGRKAFLRLVVEGPADV